MTRRRLVVSGKVQSVFYRAWFQDRAVALGLDGWIRNRADGSVEAVVQGPTESIERMIGLAREGSPLSRVAEVIVTDDAPAETLTGFAKRPTV